MFIKMFREVMRDDNPDNVVVQRKEVVEADDN